jgi:pullulanase
MNDWGVTDEMTFDGVASYSLELDLVAGDYAFKVADADWAAANFGFAVEGQAVTLSRPSNLTGGGDSQNINLTIPVDADGTYRFDFKIVNPAAPALTVSPVATP